MDLNEAFGAAGVEFDRTSARAAIATLERLPELKGPGLSQADAIQVVTQLATLRSMVQQDARYALFKNGTYGGIVEGTDKKQIEKLQAWDAAGGTIIPIVGGSSLRKAVVPPGPGLPGDWSTELALALDQTIAIIDRAEHGPNVPVGYADVVQQIPAALPLPMVFVIVTGVAVSVIGSVATWRYLDPDARAAIAQVSKASEDYRDRLEIYRSGQPMPVPSQNELAARGVVKALSDERKSHNWKYGVGAAAGVTLFVLGAAYLGRAE